jgi:hypothetical protein
MKRYLLHSARINDFYSINIGRHSLSAITVTALPHSSRPTSFYSPGAVPPTKIYNKMSSKFETVDSES